MDEPRAGRSGRRFALLLTVPIAVVAMWVSVATAGGSASEQKARSDVAKPAQVENKQRASGAFFTDGDGDCAFKGGEVTSADV